MVANLRLIVASSVFLPSLVLAVTPADVLQSMNIVNGYYMNNNPIGDCGWTRGTYYAGAGAHYLTSCTDPSGCNSSILSYITNWAESHQYYCGNSTNANDECCGQCFVDLYRLAPSADKLNLLPTLYTQVHRNATNDWNWVDALFMALPTFARYGNVTGDFSIWDKMYNLYLFTAYQDPVGSGPGLWSPEHNLFYRDNTYFNKSSPNGAPVFWARGNGWAIAAMARAIAELPRFHPYTVEFATKLQLIAGSLKPLQGSDGFWRSNLLDANEFPNPETTGTSLFTFALAWGVNNGLLVREEYENTIINAWNGLTTVAIQSNGLLGWCQPPNGQPANATSTDTSDFCVGQFLLAGSELYRFYSA